ncbi:hypothetical protein VP01_5790g2 [Puccinia sorghi]|uniref:Uncharacterized protein n=1 Tax=Puccinia sorghi TaxID=27349 RepID=A0A0L6UI73_9BASI|nr:hypothetical protein VP01_5790g2 [Puccinia sorghi]
MKVKPCNRGYLIQTTHLNVSAIISTQAGPQSSKYHCLHHDKQYITARGTTTRFHPQYNFWLCFINLLHLIKTDPIVYNKSQNPQQDVSILTAVATCHLGSNGNGAAVLRLKDLLQVGYGKINLGTSRSISGKKKAFLAALVLWMVNNSTESKAPHRWQSQEDFRYHFSSLIGNFETIIYKFPHPISHRYSISITLVCDVNKKFIYYHQGTIFSTSREVP